MTDQINPSFVRYIKLGSGGRHASKCIDENKCYIGFSTDRDEVFDCVKNPEVLDSPDACQRLWAMMYDAAQNSSETARRQVATQAKNQVLSFYKAGSETLWFTFHAGKLYHTFFDPNENPYQSPEHGGSFRKTLGWSCRDANDQELLVDRLSGQITRVQMFQGTSCEIRGSSKDYLIRRINAQKHKYITEIEDARVSLEKGIVSAIKSLTPQDFELLVELIFSRTLRRVSRVGHVQSYVDIVFENPLSSTGRAELTCVQVKSKTSKNELIHYLNDPQRKTYDQFFYVFHSSSDLDEDFEVLPEDYEGTVRILGAKRLASLVVETGLISWLVDKVV